MNGADIARSFSLAAPPPGFIDDPYPFYAALRKLARLIQGEQEGERLSEAELLHNCIFLLDAGHEPTTNLILGRRLDQSGSLKSSRIAAR